MNGVRIYLVTYPSAPGKSRKTEREMTSLCLLVLLAIALSCSAQRREIGSLPTFQHGVSGTLYAEGDRTFVIENFNYDGTGPATYVYVYEKDVTVSRLGGGLILRLPGTSDGRFPRRSYSNEQLTVSLNDCTGCRAGLTIRDLQTFTIWCALFSTFFTRLDIPANLFDQAGEDVLMPPSTYDNCEPLDDELQLSWTVDQMEDRIFFQLCGCVDAGDYMAFGLSGSDSAVQMVGADTVVTWHDSEGTGAVDYYLSARAQCRPNIQTGPRGVCPDDIQGGASNVTALSGRQESNGRCVEYVRPLSANDAILDRAITPNSAQYIVWATGPRGAVDGFAYYHTRRTPNFQTTLQFGRTPANNCAALSCPTQPSCPFAQQTFDVRNMNATFVAEIGVSGGPRGYERITGRSGWGIAWYLNSTLIPVIRATRGNTYTFLVHGGNDSSNPGKYHPFYISDSVDGGRIANTPQERLEETVYAGFDGEIASATGPLCEYQSTPSSGSVSENCATTLQDYFATLNLTCAGTRISDAGILVWTPDENTPDIVYYQCATHRNLGWKIDFTTADITSSPSLTPSPSPTPPQFAGNCTGVYCNGSLELDPYTCECKCPYLWTETAWIYQARSCARYNNGATFNPVTCGCDCVQLNNCSYNQYFNRASCSCECNNYYSCSEGMYFNTNSCRCECSNRYCPSGFYLNPSSCECECNQYCGYNEDLDYYTCQCRKKSQYPGVQCSSLQYLYTCLNAESLYGITCLWQNGECVTECCSPKPSRSPHFGYKLCPQLDYYRCSKTNYCNWRCGGLVP